MPNDIFSISTVSPFAIHKFATHADYQDALSAGLLTASEIAVVDEEVQADWNQSDPNEPDYIKNKPTIPTPSISDAGKILYVDANGHYTLLAVTNAEQHQY